MSIVRNVAWMLAGRWVYNLTTLISFTIIVALITPSDFGIYTLASTFIILSDTFFSDAVENLVVRQEGEEAQVIPTMFWVSVAFSASLALGIVLFAIPFGWFYDSYTLVHATQAVGAIVLLQGAASVPRALLMRAGRSRQYATNSAAGNLIGAVFGVAAAWAGAGFWSLIIQQSVLQVTMLAMCSIAARFHPQLIFDRAIARDFGGHVATMMWSTLLNVAGNRLDILMVGALFGSTATGIYGLAKRLIQIIQDLVASSFDKILLSMISRQGAKGQVDRIYRTSVILQGITAIPSFAGFAVISPILVPRVFGHEWAFAAPLIMLMAVGGVFRSMVTIERAQQMAAGQITTIAHVRLVELTIGLITTVPLAWAGPEVIAAIFSLRYAVGYVLVIWSRVGWRGAPLLLARTVEWLVAPVAATAIMTTTVWVTLQVLEPHARLEFCIIAGVVAGLLAFAISLYGTKRWWLPHLTSS